MVHPSAAAPAPWLEAAWLWGKVSHRKGCPTTQPSADTLLLASHVALLVAIALSYKPWMPEESQAPSIPPFCLAPLLTTIIEAPIQAR